MPLPEPVLRLLDRQFGVVGRAQLRPMLTVGEIDGYVRRGSLVTVERGVYRSAGGVLTPAGEPMAAVLRARPDARVTGPRVLALLGVDGAPRDAPFEVLVRAGRRVRNVGFRVRPDPIPDDSGATFDTTLPIVRPTAALVDSGRFVNELGRRTIRLLYDAARWKGLTDPEKVRSRCEELGPDDPGAAFFLGLAGSDGLISESDGERVLGRVLQAFQPPPEPQVWVLPDVRVDWYWRQLRLVLEYQGSVDHASATTRAHDTDRFQRLAGAGIRVVPVVAADLRDPTSLRSWLTSVTIVRARELGVPAPTLTC